MYKFHLFIYFVIWEFLYFIYFVYFYFLYICIFYILYILYILYIKSQRICDLGVQVLYFVYKQFITSAQSCPKATKRLHIKNQNEAAIKVHNARTLCTCVRTAHVFQNRRQKKRLCVETVCKVYPFRDTTLIFARILQ